MYLKIECYSKDDKWNIITIQEIDKPISSDENGNWNPSSVEYLNAFGIYDIYGSFFDHTNEQRMYNKFGDKILTRDRNKYYFVVNTNHPKYNGDLKTRLDYFKSDILKYQRKKQLSKILE